MKKVTILMPIYNASEFLKNSIGSVLSSTFSDFEFLIIDDGSTDNSKEIVKSFNDPRIRLIEKNHNYIESLNLGLELSEGKYIARMDADDIMLPNRLEAQFKILESKEDVDVCSTWMISFGGARKYKPLLTRAGYIDVLGSTVKKQRNPIYHPTVMLRKDVLLKNGLRYNPEFHVSEDLKLWVELGKIGSKFYTIPKFLHLYRVHSEQVSKTKRELQKEQTERIIKELKDEDGIN